MCEICNNKIRSFKVAIETKAFVRNLEGKSEVIPCFSEIYAPVNYCPACGRKLGE